MTVHEIVEMDGHLIDSLLLTKVLDTVINGSGDYELLDVRVGRTSTDTSHATIEVRAADEATLSVLLGEIQDLGANRAAELDAHLVAADTDGVLPVGFYSTTNLDSWVRVKGKWIMVTNPEMDCALVVEADSARTVAMHRIRRGDQVVVGNDGVRVQPTERRRDDTSFEFMNSEVSSEKPKGLIVANVAARLRATRAAGKKVLVVCGPAVIHTGAGPHIAWLVREGWIDVIFAGNGFATHDIETNVLGTSLGVSMQGHAPAEGGHSNHLRVINEVRRHGAIAAAVEAGYITGGVMYECVRRGVPFVLGGSVRDDGPLPDVYSDVVKAADAMRSHVSDVGVALMLATTLHAIATGNVLPARVETFCVDINPAVVTKLADRGSHQAVGIVTDTGLFCRLLAEELKQQ